MSKWNYSTDKIPDKFNTFIEYKGYTGIPQDPNDAPDMHFTFYLKGKLEEFKCIDKKIEYFEWVTFENLFGFDTIYKGDKWRYISNNEMMAYL